jgi:hypothetical protein
MAIVERDWRHDGEEGAVPGPAEGTGTQLLRHSWSPGLSSDDTPGDCILPNLPDIRAVQEYRLDSWQRSVLLSWLLAVMIVPALGVRMTCRHVLYENRCGPTDILNRLPWNRKPTK